MRRVALLATLCLAAGAAAGGDLLWIGDPGESPTVVTVETDEPAGGESLERMHAELSRFPLARPVAFAVAEDADRIPQPFAKLRWMPSKQGGAPALGLRAAPGWLVHQALRAGATVGVRPEVPSLRRQAASALERRRIGTEPVASPTLEIRSSPADPRPAEILVVAMVRRMDGLAGPPRDERRYLVAMGRVWIARDLYWIGLALWVTLLWVDRPGSWRRRASAERVAAGRRYIGGALFRMLFLLAFLLAPVTAAVALYPAAVLAAGRALLERAWLRGAAALVTLAVPGVVVATALRSPEPLDALRLSLVSAATLVAAIRWVLPRQARNDSQRVR